VTSGADSIAMSRELLDHPEPEYRFLNRVVQNMEPDQARVQIPVCREALWVVFHSRLSITNVVSIECAATHVNSGGCRSNRYFATAAAKLTVLTTSWIRPVNRAEVMPGSTRFSPIVISVGAVTRIPTS
jgi:hypothetical protein